MASSRTKKETPSQESIAKNNVSLFARLPIKSKPIKNFSFPHKEAEEKAGKQSFHVVHLGIENDTDKQYFIKFNPPDSVMSELEVLCCEGYRLNIGSLVPDAYVLYDEEGRLVAVASEALPGFKPNREYPLQEKDLLIVTEEIDKKCQDLINEIKRLIPCLDRSSKTYTNFGYILSFITEPIGYIYHSAMSNPIAETIKKYFENITQTNPNFSRDIICDILKLVEKRIEHVTKNQVNLKKYFDELLHLNNIIAHSESLLSLLLANKIDVRKLEEIDREIKIKKMNLEALPENEQLITNTGKTRVKDLKNYRLIRGLAKGITQSHINAENDYHNKNGSKKGERIDFDMSEWEFLSKFKECNFTDWVVSWKEKPNEKTFIFTERDILNSPVFQDAEFRYWPTKQTIVSRSNLSSSSLFENFYSSQDNENFKKLTNHPVYIFHKFETYLKNILNTEKMYQSMAEFIARNNLIFLEEGMTKNVLNEFVKYKMRRLQQLKAVLIKMPEFQRFLVAEGDYVFNLIKEEFADYQAEYKKRLEEAKEHEKPYYQNLIDSLDFKEMEKNYKDL